MPFLVFLLLCYNVEAASFFNDAIIETSSAPLTGQHVSALEVGGVGSAESVGGFASAASSSSVPSLGDEFFGTVSSSLHSPEMEPTEAFSNSEYILAKIIEKIPGCHDLLERINASIGPRFFTFFEKILKEAIVDYGEMYSKYIAESSASFFSTFLSGSGVGPSERSHMRGVLHSQECHLEGQEEYLFELLFTKKLHFCPPLKPEEQEIIRTVITRAGKEIGISPEMIASWKKDFEF